MDFGNVKRIPLELVLTFYILIPNLSIFVMYEYVSTETMLSLPDSCNFCTINANLFDAMNNILTIIIRYYL